jgi:hypothetical protein
MTRILLPLLALCLCAPVLQAQEAPRPEPKAEAGTATVTRVETRTESRSETRARRRAERRQEHHREFALQAQVNLPLRDLKERLDGRTGLGLGATWTRDHRDGHASRTRLEWNVLPEGPAVAGVRTQVSNYTLAFDHLWHCSGKAEGPYLVAGLGAVRWFASQTGPAASGSMHTTKLTVQGGAGWRFSPSFGAEVRYAVSSMDRSLDANLLQGCVSFRF